MYKRQVEYVLNRFDRVLRATAVNEDGNQILEGARLTNKPIDDAVRETLDRIASSGYFEETKPNGLVIAASCQDEKASEKLALRLEQRAQEETGSLNAKVEVAAVTVSQELSLIHIYIERFDVGDVGGPRVGHDGGRVGVDQHDLVSQLPQGLAGLGAGIVELTGLSDDNRTGANN